MVNGTITVSIRVVGILTGECLPAARGAIEIIVEAWCGGSSVASKGIATPDAGGNWSVEISKRCACNGDINVTANYATNPDVGAPSLERCSVKAKPRVLRDQSLCRLATAIPTASAT